jgi:protein-L-isoaspartate(D-aspartate) O-methyltransferase
MVELLVSRYGICDERVLAAMRAVRRHCFIPADYRGRDAYGDHPVPIGLGQTISQPFIVAHMTSLLGLSGGERVLEIGSGCGYQSAVLAQVGAYVYGVERIRSLASYARCALQEAGYTTVELLTGDGYEGWVEEAPFDAVIAGCAPEQIPAALLAQLRDGGRMVLPVGGGSQRLVVVTKHGDEAVLDYDLAVRFVPMVASAAPIGPSS